jgi:hypothetical protein
MQILDEAMMMYGLNYSVLYKWLEERVRHRVKAHYILFRDCQIQILCLHNSICKIITVATMFSQKCLNPNLPTK